MSDAIQIKLKHIAITAEELLAELQARGCGIRVVEQSEVIDDLRKQLGATCLSLDLVKTERECMAEELAKVKAERDALQANLDEATVIYNDQEQLFNKYQDAVGNLFCYGQPYDRFMEPGRTITECLPLFSAEFEKVKSERDALQARIDAGVVVYSRNNPSEIQEWIDCDFEQATHTARIIDRRRENGTRADRKESK